MARRTASLRKSVETDQIKPKPVLSNHETCSPANLGRRRLAVPFSLTRFIAITLALAAVIEVQCSAQDAAASSSAATHHVLDLDGANSWVELPQNLFTNQLVTVEGWVKWRAFGSYSRFFQFASAGQHITVANTSSNSSLRVERYNSPPFDDLRVAEVPDALRLGEWEHIALVASTNGPRLYVNGVLATTNEVPLAFRPDPLPPLKNLLGRSLVKDASNVSGDTDLNGQMDEVRLWAGERSHAQIRENMFHSLTGTEPGLLGLWNFTDACSVPPRLTSCCWISSCRVWTATRYC
jgi:Concanavalin A-like lectin/glucanases superfamily